MDSSNLLERGTIAGSGSRNAKNSPTIVMEAEKMIRGGKPCRVFASY